jgi:predicted acylesterase/phospholipase RssA
MLIANQLLESPADRKADRKRLRIGLALSGGGFRAAIFHLGVIRRLEELGIMPRIDVISAVSGGSIISAYYLCEMERRLRLVPTAERRSLKVRVLFLLLLYLVSFPVYVFVRRYAASQDGKTYKALTDSEPSARWDVEEQGAGTPKS